MTVSISTTFIPVDDPAAALDFYHGLLGLTVTKDFSHDGFRWITLATESQPEIEILLTQPQPGHSEAIAQELAALLAKGELHTVWFASDDLDATFTTLSEAAGVEVVQEPTSQPWGARDFAVRDPAGNLVRIRQA